MKKTADEKIEELTTEIAQVNDYEKTTASSAAMVKWSNIALLVRRLAPKENAQTFHYRDNTQNA